MEYRPRLDGIRALAVLVVIGFHGTGFLRGGWLGVDVFFVLSGYLITGILVREHERRGRIDLPLFYKRRFLRLAPALLLAVTVSIPLLALFPGVEAAYPPIVVVGGVLAYVGNWMQLFTPTSLGPLTHTWSLAIEEQFYLVWPAALILLVKFRGHAVAWCAAAVASLVVLRAVLEATVHWAGLWFAFTSRADALLIGAFAALVVPEIGRRVSSVLLALSGALLAIGCLTLREFSESMLYGGLTVLAVVAAVFIVTAQRSPLGVVLEWGPLVAIGRVSYGAYLYHYPVFFLINHAGVTGLAAYALKALLTAALVVGSWFLVERPALALKSRLHGDVRGLDRTGALQ